MKFSSSVSRRKFWASAFAAAFVVSTGAAARFPHGAASGVTVFSNLAIGGGGYMVSITIANDGTKLARSDVGQAWVATNSSPTWRVITNQSSLPTTATPWTTYESAIAPTDSTRIYLIWGGRTYVSNNTGTSFGATAFPTVNSASANSNQNGQNTFPSRLAGHHIAVDPQNKDVVYICYPENGCYVSLDGGATANQITAIPPAIPSNGGTQLTTNGSTASGNPTLHFASTTGATNGLTIVDLTNPAAIPAGTTVSSSTGTTVTMSKNAAATVNSSDVIAFGGPGWFGYAVAVDGHSTLTNGRSSIVYALPYGSQVYKTTNAGIASPTWAATSAGPTTYNSMQVDKDETLYVVDNQDAPSARGSIWVYNGTTWSNPNSAVKDVHAIAPDPATSGRVMAITDGGTIRLSINDAATFTDFGNNALTRTASDVPWLAPTPEQFMSAGDIAFDPSGSNKLYFAEGIGVWTTTATNSSYVWASQTLGIENLVSNAVKSSPSYSVPLLGSWDRPMFKAPSSPYTSSPSTQIPGNNTSIVMGWDIDYASANPGTFCALVTWPNNIYSDYSGCSTDGGTTWTKFATTPNVQYVTTTAPTSAGGTSLTVASLPANLAIGSTSRLPNDIGTLATTNASTSTSSNVLHFASVPANVANGMTAKSLDNPDNLQQSVSSFTSTTVTLGGNPIGTIASGERILFMPLTPPLNSQIPISSASGTTINLGQTIGGSGVLAGETIQLALSNGGSIAASSSSNIMILGQNNILYPWYTTDGGATWKNVLICATYSGGACASAATGFNIDGSAILEGGASGWGFAYYTNTKNVAADRVDANTFYLYNSRTGAGGGGFYMSADGGATLTRKNSSTPISGNSAGQNAAIKTVPGNSGHIFINGGGFTSGNIGRSCDHGTTWNDILGITSVKVFAFGKPKPGGNGYPTVFAIGTVGGIASIYRADDVSPTCAATTPTWIDLNNQSQFPAPPGIIDDPTSMDGDQSTYGTVYIGRGSTGWAVGVLH